MEPREYDGLICNNNILLSWAANFNHLDVLRYLVAQPGIVTKTSTKSALFNAVHLGYVEAVRLILTHGGDSLYAKSLLRSLQSNSLMEEVIHHGLEREAISLKTPLLDKRHIVRL